MPAKKSSNYIWKGIYPTWTSACEAAKVMGSDVGFSDDRWFQRIKQQLLDYRNELQQYGVAMPPRPSNLPLVCAIVDPNSVLDFGGSSGWCWDYLKSSVVSHHINSYQIVETKDVVNFMNESKLHNDPVQYMTIDAKIKSCDLFYCNSVLQYFESNAILMQLIEQTKPRYILLDELAAKGGEDLYSLQTSYDSKIPYRFIGLSKLLAELEHHGYDEMARYPYASPILGVIKPFEMENFPKEKQLRYSLSVLLQKKPKK